MTLLGREMQKNTGFQPSSESEFWSLGGIVQGWWTSFFPRRKKPREMWAGNQKKINWALKEKMMGKEAAS